MSMHVEVVEIPSVPFGRDGDPRTVDAEYYREAARNIRFQAVSGNAFAGSNLTETVAKLCIAAAEALELPAMQTFVAKHQCEWPEGRDCICDTQKSPETWGWQLRPPTFCGAISPKLGLFCDRVPGHDGRHVELWVGSWSSSSGDGRG